MEIYFGKYRKRIPEKRYFCSSMRSEFEWIDLLAGRCRSLPANGFEGIGDDCAVLPVGGGEALVFTADLLVEEVHFLRRAVEPEELACKALQVNLSDVAAMGARPVATLLSVALPADTMRGDWADRFAAGYAAASQRAGVNLVGGDTTASKGGIAINVTAVGRAPLGHLQRRGDARPGDAILVAGRLGASGAGLKEILAGRYDTPLARVHKLPEAQVDEGVWLGGRPEVHAMMDLSDGLASDLKHILERSGVGAEVDTERIPVAEGADLETALCGGEDYKLLLTADAACAEALCGDFEVRFGRELFPIGRTAKTAEKEIRWLRAGRPVAAGWRGFEHHAK